MQIRILFTYAFLKEINTRFQFLNPQLDIHNRLTSTFHKSTYCRFNPKINKPFKSCFILFKKTQNSLLFYKKINFN